MKLSEKWKRWLRRLDLVIMIWWAAYDSARMFFPKYYPYIEMPDMITFFGTLGWIGVSGWLKIYESEEVPEEDLRWMRRIRAGLYMLPLLVGIIYDLYLLYPKLNGVIWRWPTI